MADDPSRTGAPRRVRSRGTTAPRAALRSPSSAAVPALPLAAVLLLAVGTAGPGPAAAQEGEPPGDTVERAPVADSFPDVWPYRLPELEVEARRGPRSGKMAGFDRRRRRHPAGIFVGREEIERRDPREVSDLLWGLAGVTPARRPAGTGQPRVRMDRTARVPGQPTCRVRFFVDGVPLPRGGAFRVDAIPPGDVEGIEIYRGVSEVPPHFQRRGDRCGVVVIWTRDPSDGDRP